MSSFNSPISNALNHKRSKQFKCKKAVAPSIAESAAALFNAAGKSLF